MMPDYCEAITAYRCWVIRQPGLLISQHIADLWVPYAAHRANCQHTESTQHLQPDLTWSPAPIAGCSCGIYGYKTEADLLAHAIDRATPQNYAFGVVRLWGRLIECERGYRAEYGYPGALRCRDAGAAAWIAAIYGVSCEVVVPTPAPVEDPAVKARLTAIAQQQRDAYSLQYQAALQNSNPYQAWSSKKIAPPPDVAALPELKEPRASLRSLFTRSFKGGTKRND